MSIYAAVPAHYMPDTMDSAYGYQPTDLYYDYGYSGAAEYQQKPNSATTYYDSDIYPPTTYHPRVDYTGWQPSRELHAPSPKHPSPLIEQETAASLQWREYPDPASAEPDIAAYDNAQPSYPVWDVPASRIIPPIHHPDVLAEAPPLHSYQAQSPKRRRDSQPTLLDNDRKAAAADTHMASLLERQKALANERQALVDAHIIVPRVPRSTAVPFVSQTRLASSKPAFATSASGADWHIQAAIAAAAQPEEPEPDTLVKGTGRIGKAPHVACYFCRARKIACGRPTDGADGPCNQCAKRGLAHKCEYPPSSKRGQHKRPLKSTLEGLEFVASGSGGY